MHRTPLLAIAAATLLQEPGGAPAPAPMAADLHDFEATPPGGLPKGFTVASTLGDEKARATPAKWAVAEDAKAPSGRRVVKLTETTNQGAVYNLLLRDEAAPVDLALSVQLRADSGGEDRGGGLVWRAKDERNYYVCRWNPLEKNLRAYRVSEGRRVQLQSVTIETAADAWHRLAVTMKGRVMEISFDGKREISCADATFGEAGKVGLWTKADAHSSFDDLKVGPAP